MGDDDLDLAGLLCSRICHDLISPVGAIGNGLELLPPTPDDNDVRALLTESAQAARAALAFFRVAFGAVGSGAAVTPTQELGVIAGAHFANSRHRLAWPLHGDPLPRAAARLQCLMLLAGATATPIGGTLAVAQPVAAPLALQVTASGRRAGLSAEATALLTGAPGVLAEAPRDAHLALAARLAARLGATLTAQGAGETVVIAARAS